MNFNFPWELFAKERSTEEMDISTGKMSQDLKSSYATDDTEENSSQSSEEDEETALGVWGNRYEDKCSRMMGGRCHYIVMIIDRRMPMCLDTLFLKF